MKHPVLALVLAAGQGTRFHSETNKVLHPLLGKSSLRLVLDAVLELKPEKTIVVVGFDKEAVIAEAGYSGLEFVEQKEPKGTAHAVAAAKNALKARRGEDVLIVPADLPLLQSAVLKSLISSHRRHDNAATVMSQIYLFDVTDLRRALTDTVDRKGKGECDLAEIFADVDRAGKKTEVMAPADPGSVLSVDTRIDFVRAVQILRIRKIRDLAESGVTVLNPASTWIDLEAKIGRDTVVYPSVVIEGRTVVGSHCRIFPGAHIINSRIGQQVRVLDATVIESADIEDRVSVGPFARIRPKTVLSEGSYVGNFVEVKNTRFGRGSKAGHLTYLGDADVGERVNIGAGTITCNYDGVRKNRTVIEDGAFVGSGAELVAPVRIGKGAYVAAGSVITKDVTPDALAVSRGRQFEKEGWARRRRERQKPGSK
jgi:bifunctional UDP-N-acetylglucosamine pyrophosphorylase/glucosamine-1-phosphate N-acetyltransferase